MPLIEQGSGSTFGLAQDSTSQSIAGFNIPKYDEIDATYPDSTHEVYVYKLATITQATITVTYTDTTKQFITSVIKS